MQLTNCDAWVLQGLEVLYRPEFMMNVVVENIEAKISGSFSEVINDFIL